MDSQVLATDHVTKLMCTSPVVFNHQHHNCIAVREAHLKLVNIDGKWQVVLFAVLTLLFLKTCLIGYQGM
uniref:Transmembrane protein n=1 Tax=Anguilla anguilla TaxID=7936 RepID=A0A0E9RZT2_ANGAN